MAVGDIANLSVICGRVKTRPYRDNPSAVQDSWRAASDAPYGMNENNTAIGDKC